LRQRLVQAGYREADVARFERADLLAYYAKVLLAETAYVPPPQRGDDVDVEEAAAVGGDAEEIGEGESDPSHGSFGDEVGDFQMRFLVLEEKKLEEQRVQREEQRQLRELEMMRLEEKRRQREEQNQMEQLRLEEQKRQREEQNQMVQKRLEFEQMKWKEELE